MVSELGECIRCFPDNRGQDGATGSDLGNGIRQKRILISPEPVRHLNMCLLSQNTTYIQYIFKYIKYINTYIYTHIHNTQHTHTHTHTHIYIYMCVCVCVCVCVYIHNTHM